MFGHERIQKLFYTYIPLERTIPQFKRKKDMGREESDTTIRESKKPVKH